jgi:hypothetical protein
MTRALLVGLVAALACGGRTRPASRAGDELDEGGGALARASIQLRLGSDDTKRAHGDEDDDASDGSAPFGGDAYGGATYAGWTATAWTPSTSPHVMPYTPAYGLTGALEGTVSWHGPIPSTLLSTCGPIAHPTLRVGTDQRLVGASVYIERLQVGRVASLFPGVGGIVAKRGCAFVPAAQLVASVPANVTLYGDATRTRVWAGAVGALKAYDLQEAGRVELAVTGGVLEIASADGRIAPAWVLALDTPAYAITDDAGRYRIEQLAPGSYDVTFWQAPIATSGPDGVFSHGPPIVVHRRVQVAGEKVAHVDVALSAR